MTSDEKDAYWLVVRECLIEFHDLSKHEAQRRVGFFRRNIESVEPEIKSDIFYHNEPFDVAGYIAGREIEMSDGDFNRYEQILQGKFGR
jgi:hypothetical protein